MKCSFTSSDLLCGTVAQICRQGFAHVAVLWKEPNHLQVSGSWWKESKEQVSYHPQTTSSSADFTTQACSLLDARSLTEISKTGSSGSLIFHRGHRVTDCHFTYPCKLQEERQQTERKNLGILEKTSLIGKTTPQTLLKKLRVLDRTNPVVHHLFEVVV